MVFPNPFASLLAFAENILDNPLSCWIYLHSPAVTNETPTKVAVIVAVSTNHSLNVSYAFPCTNSPPIITAEPTNAQTTTVETVVIAAVAEAIPATDAIAPAKAAPPAPAVATVATIAATSTAAIAVYSFNF